MKVQNTKTPTVICRIYLSFSDHFVEKEVTCIHVIILKALSHLHIINNFLRLTIFRLSLFTKCHSNCWYTTDILLQVETGDGNQQGKWLLYLTDQIEISPPGVGKCFINPRNINFLGLRHRQKQSELVTQADTSQEASSHSQYKYSSQQTEFNSIAGIIQFWKSRQIQCQYKSQIGPSLIVLINTFCHDLSRRFLSTSNCSSYSYFVNHFGSFDENEMNWFLAYLLPDTHFIFNYTKLFNLSGEPVEKDDEYYSSSSSNSYSSKQSIYTKTVKSSSRTVEKSYSSGSYQETVNKRYKRDVEHVVEPDYVMSEDGSVSRVVVFDCGRKSAKCFTISCNLPRLRRRDFAVIKLRSRVWNSTLVEDYPHIDSVVINARARLEMAPEVESQQMRGDDETTISVMAFPDGLSETGMANIPIWVMVVSIMTGLLVVVIITLILWKFGFFERKRVSDVAHSVTISKQHYHQYPPLMNGNEYIS